jgi:hypothetical protein
VKLWQVPMVLRSKINAAEKMQQIFLPWGLVDVEFSECFKKICTLDAE